mgnify:CR=1 FL=1
MPCTWNCIRNLADCLLWMQTGASDSTCMYFYSSFYFLLHLLGLLAAMIGTFCRYFLTCRYFLLYMKLLPWSTSFCSSPAWHFLLHPELLPTAIAGTFSCICRYFLLQLQTLTSTLNIRYIIHNAFSQKWCPCLGNISGFKDISPCTLLPLAL